MDIKKIGIVAALAVVLALGVGTFLWSRGSADRVQEKLDLAVKYISENEFDKAILAYNDAVKINPKEVKAYQGLARVYTLQGKYDDAENAYERGLAAVEPDKQVAIRLGLAGMYIDRNQLEQAEKSFQGIKNINKNCLEAYWGLAMVYQQQGDNTKAEAMLKQAIEQNPNEYRAYNTLALFFKQNQKTDDAFNNLVKSLTLEINQQEAYLVLSDLYEGSWNKLQARLTTVTNQQVSAMLEFYMNYACGDNPKALNGYKSKLNGQSGNHKARILAAIAMFKTGDKTGAQNLIDQVIKENVNDWLLSDLATYYKIAGDNEKAKATALKALQGNGTNLEAIAILQNLNTGQEKLYAAEYLLYNWKPVGKVKEELEGIYPFNLPTATSSNKSEGVELTPDYFIPDINKRYVSDRVLFIASNQIETEATVVWSKDNQGKYIKREEIRYKKSTMDFYDLYEDTFLIQNNFVYCTNSEGAPHDAGGFKAAMDPGKWIKLKPVLPGDSWNSIYAFQFDYGSENYIETTTFVGIEDLTVMGKKEQAAHLHVLREEKSSYGTIKYDEDYWLVRNVGIVKSISKDTSRGTTKNYELTAIH